MAITELVSLGVFVWDGGGRWWLEQAEMTCSQNSWGVGGAVAGNRARKNVQVGPHTYPHQYSQRGDAEIENWVSAYCGWFSLFQESYSLEDVPRKVLISSQLVTAS